MRTATADDIGAIRWALFAALDWDPDRTLPPFDFVLAHPEAERYHRDWGRPGDLGVIGELDGQVVGVAYGRLFTDDDHGHGYVDDETPEVASRGSASASTLRTRHAGCTSGSATGR